MSHSVSTRSSVLIFLTWCIIFFTCNYCASSDLPNERGKDVVLVYRKIRSSEVISQVHRRGKSKYMLLKNGNEYLDSVLGMESLHCSPVTSHCLWEVHGEWTYVDVSVSEDNSFVIDVEKEVQEGKEGCDKNNGGCPFLCRMKDDKVECYRPAELPYERVDCPSPVIKEMGSFRWDTLCGGALIVPSNTVTEIRVEIGRGIFKIFEEIEDNKFTEYGTLTGGQTLTSDRKVYVFYERNHYYGGDYRDYLKVDFIRKHLKLAGGKGTLSYHFPATYESLCVSVIYKGQTNQSQISLNIKFSNGTEITLLPSGEVQFGEWKSTYFSFDEKLKKPVTLVLEVTGTETILHSIFGCSPYDDAVTYLASVPSFPDVHKGEVQGANTSCLNGGIVGADETCVCPEGFSGEKCEKACGPYNIGENCSIECSPFSSPCSGMMFCKDRLFCHCASGYEGEKCEQSCSWGNYGSNCKQNCGRCADEVCNIYSGICENGCIRGYVAPMCQNISTYFTRQPIINYQDLNTVTVSIDTESTAGVGEIKFYQIQYKETQGLETWSSDVPQLIDGEIKKNITGLSHGLNYTLRIVCITEDGNSYQGELVPTVNFTTLCTVPFSENYNIVQTLDDEACLTWKYDTNDTDCPIMGYQVTLQRKTNKVVYEVSPTEESFCLENLRPGNEFLIYFQALTRFGNAPSAILSLKLQGEFPIRVTNLSVSDSGPTYLEISWNSLRFSDALINKYIVHYKCQWILACEESCGNHQQLSVDGNQTIVKLNDLQPHVQYVIQVAGESVSRSEFTSTYGMTQSRVPDAIPEMRKDPVIISQNTSISINWWPSWDCYLLNGYFNGYRYELLSPNQTIVSSIHTSTLIANFTGLVPQTNYLAHFYVTNTVGWNTDKKLVLNVSTTATVPEKVQHLTVYKRGRRLIAIRWAAPINSYGEIHSYSVAYCQLSNCDRSIAIVVNPTPCAAYTNFFCYIITKLLPNHNYSISVSAKNVFVNKYGVETRVTAFTSEGAPGSPESLSIHSRTPYSVSLQWKQPSLLNGVLRSFVITVEHIDSANSELCCEYIPLMEIPIKSEQEAYFYEVTGLKPASKYNFGVSAKTVSIGQAVSLTACTPPKILLERPEIHDNTVRILSVNQNSAISGIFLLIVMIPEDNATAVLWDNKIAEELQKKIGSMNFYIVQEYTTGDLVNPIYEKIGQGTEPHNGTIGVVEDPMLTNNFSVGLAAILEYNGAANIEFVTGRVELLDLDYNT